jgi:mannose-6-phosphate isomerase-like protein (cupin superfamily)
VFPVTEVFLSFGRLLASKFLRGRQVVKKINIQEKLNAFSDHWNPRVIAELNGQHVKVAKFKGEFTWHHHENEDELFLVLKGRLLMKFRDRDIWVEEGEMIVVPRKVEHMPVALEEVHVVLFEPASTLNTGNVIEERTRKNLHNL